MLTWSKYIVLLLVFKTIIVAHVCNTVCFAYTGMYKNNLWHNNISYHNQVKEKIAFISGNFTVYDKLYDNDISATINNNNLLLDGVEGGDIVTLESVQVAFISPGVGVQKKVIITAATLGGPDGSTYTLSLDGAPVSYADILGVNYLGGDGRGDFCVAKKSLSLDGQSVFFWVGGTEGSEYQWFTGNNWNQGLVPGSNEMIVIPATNHPPVVAEAADSTLVIEGIIQISNDASLTIEAGASLLIRAEASVNTGENAFIVLHDGAAYLNKSQSVPRLIVQHGLQGGAGWRNLSSPVQTSYADLCDGAVTQGFNGSDFPDLQPNLMWWHEASHGTTLQHWRMPDSIGDPVLPGKGYFLFVFDGARILNPDGTLSENYYHDELPLTLDVTGIEHSFNEHNVFDFGVTFTPTEDRSFENTLNSTYIETNVADLGWNLAGNPTASILNWDSDQGWIKNNIDDVIYVWDPSVNSGEYLTWNGVAGSLGSGMINPFTAFWIKANSTEPSLSFNNMVKTLGTGPGSKNDTAWSSCDEIIIQLRLMAHGMKTLSYVVLSKNGKIGHDNKDAYRLKPLSNTWLALYMNSSPDHLSPLVINSLPIEVHHELLIPAFVYAVIDGKSMGGDFLIEWDIPPCWPDNLFIYLMDHRHEKAVSMLNHNHYTFQAPPTTKSYPAAINPLDLPKVLVSPRPDLNTTKNGSLKALETHDHPFSIVISKDTFWKDPGYVPDQPILLTVYPNPFFDRIKIPFRLVKQTQLSIEIYDVYGRLADVAAKGTYPPGITEITWCAANHPPGLYFIRLISKRDILVEKVMKVDK